MGGQCTGCVGNGKSQKHYEFQEFPTDIDEYSPSNKPNLPKLVFDALLCNIKICDSPKEALSMKFWIQQHIEVLLPRKARTTDTHEIKWKSKEKFKLQTNAFDLRCKFLNIEAVDEKAKPIASMKINLYMIATGPYHHDFCFKLDKSQARLQFDFKISQELETKLSCKQTEIQFLNKDYPGQNFNFSLSLLKEDHDSYIESGFSYTKKIPLIIKHQAQMLPNQLDQCPSPIRIKKKSLAKPISSYKVFWDSKKGDMPEIKKSLSSTQITNSLLHFVIWNVDEQTDSSSIFADQYISINKLFKNNPTEITDESKNMVLEERKIEIKKQKLYKNGEEFVDYSMQLTLQNSQYIKQMQACARTQKGIIPMNPYINQLGIKRSNRQGKLTALCEAMNKIEKLNMEINQSISLNFIERRSIKEQMLTHFVSIRKMLEDDHASSFAQPSNEEEILQTIENQSTFLTILGKVVGYLEDEEIYSQINWFIALTILKRGEFLLNNIGFCKKEWDEIQKPKQDKLLQKKIKNALSFQELLYKFFFLSLKVSYIEGRQSPKQVIEMFKAFCYFRIPEYREIILEKVSKNEDTQIVQLKVQTNQKEMGAFNEQQDLILSIDWQNFFYRPLKNVVQSQNLVKDLVENLDGNKWLDQLSKRSTTFFYFVEYLIMRLNQLGKKMKFIQWKYFPGYNKLVRSFLCEMKKKDLIKYSESLMRTSVYLLTNDRLVSLIISIVLEKTNAYDSRSVLKSFDLISRYLDHLTKEKKLLPPTFNYISFYKALKIVLEGDFSYSIAKALALIYNHYLHFNSEFRRNLTMYLLGKVFFKLFLNWSYSVRSTFYHLLLLKIDKAADIFNPQNRKQYGNMHEMMGDIYNRYEQVITIVRNAEIVRKNDEKKRIFKNQKSLHEKMRKKLHYRMKLKNSTEKSESPTNQLNIKERINQDFSTEKYSISQLTRQNLDRSSSAIINVSKLNLFLPKNTMKGNENQQEAQVHRIISDTNNTEKHLEEMEKPKEKKKRRFSISICGQTDLKEMQKNEFEYLAIGVKEFNEIEDAIKKYIVEYEELPVCELQKLIIPIDKKEIRVSDVENWQ